MTASILRSTNDSVPKYLVERALGSVAGMN